MKVIYHCFGGSHSSVTAAAIHLGMLASNRLPTGEELMRIPYFDKTSDDSFGLIKFMGNDEFGNQVYVLGKKGLGERFSRVLEGMAEILGVNEELAVTNTMVYVNWMMMIGGYLSRRIGLPRLGRPLVIAGTRRAFFDLVAAVQKTKLRVASPYRLGYRRESREMV